MLASIAEREQTRTLLRAKLQLFPDIPADSVEILVRLDEVETGRIRPRCLLVRTLGLRISVDIFVRGAITSLC